MRERDPLKKATTNPIIKTKLKPSIFLLLNVPYRTLPLSSLDPTSTYLNLPGLSVGILRVFSGDGVASPGPTRCYSAQDEQQVQRMITLRIHLGQEELKHLPIADMTTPEIGAVKWALKQGLHTSENGRQSTRPPTRRSTPDLIRPDPERITTSFPSPPSPCIIAITCLANGTRSDKGNNTQAWDPGPPLSMKHPDLPELNEWCCLRPQAKAVMRRIMHTKHG